MNNAIPSLSSAEYYQRYQQAVSEVKLDGAAVDAKTDRKLSSAVLRIAGCILDGYMHHFNDDDYERAVAELDYLQEWQKGSYLRLAQVIAKQKLAYPLYRERWHQQAIEESTKEGVVLHL